MHPTRPEHGRAEQPRAAGECTSGLAASRTCLWQGAVRAEARMEGARDRTSSPRTSTSWHQEGITTSLIRRGTTAGSTTRLLRSPRARRPAHRGEGDTRCMAGSLRSHGGHLSSPVVEWRRDGARSSAARDVTDCLSSDRRRPVDCSAHREPAGLPPLSVVRGSVTGDRATREEKGGSRSPPARSPHPTETVGPHRRPPLTKRTTGRSRLAPSIWRARCRCGVAGGPLRDSNGHGATPRHRCRKAKTSRAGGSDLAGSPTGGWVPRRRNHALEDLLHGNHDFPHRHLGCRSPTRRSRHLRRARRPLRRGRRLHGIAPARGARRSRDRRLRPRHAPRRRATVRSPCPSPSYSSGSVMIS